MKVVLPYQLLICGVGFGVLLGERITGRRKNMCKGLEAVGS